MGTLVLVSCLTGCHGGIGLTQEQRQRLKEELPLLQMGKEYPIILPPERSHKLTIKLRRLPQELNERDLAEIESLASRVPALLTYELRDIRKSVTDPGCYDVWIVGAMIKMKQTDHWVIYLIGNSPVE
jgi:hypothetical protein